MRKLLVGATRWFVLVGLMAILVACGSSGDGTRQLTEDDYLLDVSATMLPADYDDATQVWLLEASGIDSEGRLDTDWVQPMRSVGAGGAIGFTVDARDMNQNSPPLSPRQYLHWYTGTTTAELPMSVSDPAARWEIVRQLAVFQVSPDDYSLGSHSLISWFDEGNLSRAAAPIFSDRPVTLAGSWTRGSFSYELDATLQAGWNFLHYRSGDTSGSLILTAFPATGNEEFDASRNNISLTQATIEEAYGVSVFAEHTLTSATPMALTAFQYPGGFAPIRVSAWLGFADRNPALVPLDQIYAGVLNSSNVSFTPADAVGLIASPHAYDSAAVSVANWFQAPTGAMGTVHITSAAGNTVLAVYSDRSATLTLTDPVDDGSGNSLTTDPGGLELQFGWNRIELVPDGGNILKLTRVTAIPPNADPILTIN